MRLKSDLLRLVTSNLVNVVVGAITAFLIPALLSLNQHDRFLPRRAAYNRPWMINEFGSFQKLPCFGSNLRLEYSRAQ